AYRNFMTKCKGKVKWFDSKRGFGFIIGPESQDVFVHYSHINMDGYKTLREAQEVAYTLVEVKGKPQAHDVSNTKFAE
ncbi:hypothetical protein LCGC14_2396100, partial [marine sediment metagenome]